MTVTGPSYNINAVALLSKQDLEKGIIGKGSWHDEYKDSHYIFVGGLPYKITEGDVVILFSQYGEIVDVHLVRDKQTGASKGYGFIGYENQKSTILAVDNFNGYELLGKRLRVDHCKNYRAKVDQNNPYEPSGPEGKGRNIHGVLKSVQALREPLNTSPQREVATRPEPPPRTRILDEDEKWAEQFNETLRKEKKKKKKLDTTKKEKIKSEKIKLEKVKKEKIKKEKSPSLERTLK